MTKNPDANDLTNAYQNYGYMFSTINPVEVSADGNVIDMEIRISEGKPAYFNKVTVVGNDVTNDHVIYRELRTRPGELYRKSEIIRTIRELGQLGFLMRNNYLQMLRILTQLTEHWILSTL